MGPKEQKFIDGERKTSAFDRYKYIQQGMWCNSKCMLQTWSSDFYPFSKDKIFGRCLWSFSKFSIILIIIEKQTKNIYKISSVTSNFVTLLPNILESYFPAQTLYLTFFSIMIITLTELFLNLPHFANLNIAKSILSQKPAHFRAISLSSN